MNRLFASIVIATLTACGASNPPPVTPVPPPKQADRPAVPESRAALFVEFIPVHRSWVTKYVPDGADDVKKWADTATLEPSFYWILVKGSDAAAKAKAQKLLDRTKKEPFGKVAREGSEDPGSRDKGGEYPPAAVKQFVKEVQDAWAALKPGETSPLFKSQFGWGFVKKAPPADETLAKLYRQAKSGEATKKLGDEILKRIKNSPDTREAIADSVQTVLGDSAVADPDRPQINVVHRERIQDLKHLPEAAKKGLGNFAEHAKPGDIMDAPVGDDDVVIVARAVAAAG